MAFLVTKSLCEQTIGFISLWNMWGLDIGSVSSLSLHFTAVLSRMQTLSCQEPQWPHNPLAGCLRSQAVNTACTSYDIKRRNCSGFVTRANGTFSQPDNAEIKCICNRQQKDYPPFISKHPSFHSGITFLFTYLANSFLILGFFFPLKSACLAYGKCKMQLGLLKARPPLITEKSFSRTF